MLPSTLKKTYPFNLPNSSTYPITECNNWYPWFLHPYTEKLYLTPGRNWSTGWTQSVNFPKLHMAMNIYFRNIKLKITHFEISKANFTKVTENTFAFPKLVNIQSEKWLDKN